MINRRNTLAYFGAATLGMNLPALAFQPTSETPIPSAASGAVNEAASVTPKVVCRVIGVGDAGINVLVAAFSSGLIHAPDCQPEFAAVNLGRKGITAAIMANRMHPEFAPIRPVQLGRYGAGGNINIARAAARKYDRTLRSLVDGAEIVILVMCISGSAGAGVGPMLAKMSQESGALTLAVVIVPFPWEVFQWSSVLPASKELERECTYLVTLPNQVIGDLLGKDATLEDLVAQQELCGSFSIHSLMTVGSRFCIDRRRPA
jgi:cell division GTPase FtsZ